MNNIGVGPLKSRFGLFLVQLILTQIGCVSFRDASSANICIELVGLREEKWKQVQDAVFIISAKLFGYTQYIREMKKQPMRIAINLNYEVEFPEHWDDFVNNLLPGIHSVSSCTTPSLILLSLTFSKEI